MDTKYNGLPVQIVHMLSTLEMASITIAAGASLSSALNLDNLTLVGQRLFGIIMPAAWTAANLTFQGSWDGGITWYDLLDAESGAAIVAVATAGKAAVLRDPTVFAAVPWLRARSGTEATPVAQTADRQLVLVLRGI